MQASSPPRIFGYSCMKNVWKKRDCAARTVAQANAFFKLHRVLSALRSGGIACLSLAFRESHT